MRKQDNLVQFISSMSATEKKFFKEYIKKSNLAGEYLTLFNALESVNIYDTAELAQRLGKTKAKLAHEKERLQELLLRSLRLWTETTTYDQTSDLLVKAQEVSLMAGRNLYNYAYGMGKKAAENALQHQRYYLSNILLNSNADCLAIMGDYPESIKLKEIVIQNNSIIMENDELSLLQLKVIKAVSRGQVAPGQFKYLPEHPLMKKPTGRLKSYNAKMTQLAIWCYYYENIQKDNARLLGYVKKIYNLCLASQKAPYFDASQMAIAMCHLIMVLSMGGKYEDAMQKLDELDEWLARNKKAHGIYKFERYSEVQRLVLYNELHQFEKTAEAAGKLVRWQKEEFLGYNEATLFYYAIALFHTGKTDVCLKVLQKLLSIESRTRQELIVPTRILFIMAQYETGNRRLLPHLINALKAFLKRTPIKVEGTGSLYKFFTRLAKSSYHPVSSEDWNTFSAKIKGDEFGENVREIFIGLWLKEKCQMAACPT